MNMKFFQTKRASYISDFICSILLGSAACAAVFPLIGFKANIGGCLLIMTADVLLVFIFSRKWWILPALIISAAIIILPVLAFTDNLEMLIDSFFDFIEWAFRGFAETSAFSNFLNLALASVITALPIAALSYLYFRKLFVFAALPPVSLALIFWMHFNGLELFLDALVLLLAVTFISLAKMIGNKSNRHLSESYRIPGVYNQLSAIIIMPFILVLTFLFVPEADGDFRFKPLVNIVDDFRDLFGFNDDNLPAQGTFNISASGFSPLGHRLGGDVALNNKVVLRVTTATPAKLTGAVFETYTGTQWYDSHKLKRYRLSSLFWQNNRLEAFGLNKPTAADNAKTLYGSLTVPASFEISAASSGTTLFSAGQMHTIKSDSLDISDVFFNRQSELFVSGARRLSLRYNIGTTIFDRHADCFETNMSALETAMEGAFDPDYESIKNIYLQLPESLPDKVYDTAKRITSHIASPYQKAAAIERWLSKNCGYTLSPGTPPQERDFVDYFLETREGYCVYYASAMAILSRCAGLPSRYVTGFSLKHDPYSKSPEAFVATNATAHAWAEVYFKGIGWIAFDATDWNYYDNAETESWHIGQSGNAYRPSENVSSDVSSGDALSDNENAVNTSIKALIILLVLFVLAAAAIACVRFVRLLTGAEGFYKRLCRKYADLENRMNACYRRIITQAGFLRIKLKPDDTIASFARRVDKQLGGNLMYTACESVIRMRFALQSPADNDIKQLCAFSTELEKRIRKILGLRSYIWRRLLLGR